MKQNNPQNMVEDTQTNRGRRSFGVQEEPNLGSPSFSEPENRHEPTTDEGRQQQQQRNRRFKVVNKKGKRLYDWEQTSTAVTIFLDLPESLDTTNEENSTTIFCTIADDSVQLGAITNGYPCAWYLNHFTGGPVDLSKSYWQQGDKEITIGLVKETPGTYWNMALLDERIDHQKSPKPRTPKFFRRSLSNRDIPDIFRRTISSSSLSSSADDKSSNRKKEKRSRNLSRGSSSKSLGSERSRNLSRGNSSKSLGSDRSWNLSRGNSSKSLGSEHTLLSEMDSSMTTSSSHTKDRMDDRTKGHYGKSRKEIELDLADYKEELQEIIGKKRSSSTERSTLYIHQEPKEIVASLEEQLKESKEMLISIQKYNKKKVHHVKKVLDNKQKELSDEKLYLQALNARVKELQDKLSNEKGTNSKEESSKEAIISLEDEIARAIESETIQKEVEIQNLKSELDRKMHKGMDATVDLEHQTKTLLESQSKSVEDQVWDLLEKEEKIQSLEMELKEEKRRQNYRNMEELSRPSDGQELQDMIEALQESRANYKEMYRDMYVTNKKGKKKIQKLEDELEQQLSQWARLEKDIDLARQKVARMESSKVTESVSINEFLDRLYKKMLAARTKLESLQDKRRK